MNRKQHILLLVLIASVVFAACKRSGSQSGSPVATDSGTQTSLPAATADTTSVVTDSTSTSDGKTKYRLELEQDSAEITNLRIFTRKQKEIYDAALLIGEWVRGTEHEVYLADGTGRMWDTSEDIAAGEAQRFNWTLDSNLLTIVCHLELGGVLPKRYVVTYADEESLAYQDLYGTAYLWDRK